MSTSFRTMVNHPNTRITSLEQEAKPMRVETVRAVENQRRLYVYEFFA